MPRPLFPIIAALGIFCAGAGIWFGGLRNETAIARTLESLPRPNDTPFYRCADSFYWVSYARQMIDHSDLRVRFTRLDNAPFGRANLGWSSLNAWYLVGLAEAWSFVTRSPIDTALAQAASWASPLLYSFFLVGLLAIGWRAKNFPAASAAVFILGTSPRVYDDFAYAVPGHHGWHDIAGFATLACLTAGIRKPHPRKWFIAAGFAGAVAIWIGVTQQAFGLAAAGAGVIAGILVARIFNPARSTPLSGQGSLGLPAPENWRFFGSAGAVAALLFYAIEYLPGPLTMRLEVNHPIYALGLLLGGEFLCRAQRVLTATDRHRGRDLWIAIALALVLAAIVALIFLGPAGWHTMRQPFIQRLHHEIAEFQSVTLSAGHQWIMILGAPIFLTAVTIFRGVQRHVGIRERVALFVCAFPCAIAIALSFVQLRWAGIAGAASAAMAAVLCADIRKVREGAKSIDPLIPQLACILCPLLFVAGWFARQNDNNTRLVRAESIDRVATMELAAVLKTDPSERAQAVVFSAHKERQAWIGYVTGIPAVGSLYWDNPQGIRDEAQLLATYDDETAHRLALARGITHFVISPDGDSVIAYHYMWRGNKTAPQIRETLAYRLAAPNPRPPSWLQLVPTETPAMTRERIRVYRVL